MKTFREQAEKVFLSRKLEASDWDVTQTASALGVKSGSLLDRIKELNLGRDA